MVKGRVTHLSEYISYALCAPARRTDPVFAAPSGRAWRVCMASSAPCTSLAGACICTTPAHYPPLVGLGFVAYMFGLRHAFDADHIAAVDDTVRYMLQKGKKPLGVGFFFSLGPFDDCTASGDRDRLRRDRSQARAAAAAETSAASSAPAFRAHSCGSSASSTCWCCSTFSRYGSTAKIGTHSHAHLEAAAAAARSASIACSADACRN